MESKNRFDCELVRLSYCAAMETIAPPPTAECSGSAPVTRCRGKVMVMVGGASWNFVRIGTGAFASKASTMSVLLTGAALLVSAQKLVPDEAARTTPPPTIHVHRQPIRSTTSRLVIIASEHSDQIIGLDFRPLPFRQDGSRAHAFLDAIDARIREELVIAEDGDGLANLHGVPAQIQDHEIPIFVDGNDATLQGGYRRISHDDPLQLHGCCAIRACRGGFGFQRHR